MKRAAVGAVAMALVAVAAGARPECAYACTCAPLDPERALAQADAALVARVVTRHAVGAEATLDLAVERRIKGDLGPRVQVVTASSGAACGIEAAPGTRFGLFLTRSGDTWRGSLCDQAPVAELAALPTAPNDGEASESEQASPRGVTDSEEESGSVAVATALALGAIAFAAAGIVLLRRKLRPE